MKWPAVFQVRTNAYDWPPYMMCMYMCNVMFMYDMRTRIEHNLGTAVNALCLPRTAHKKQSYLYNSNVENLKYHVRNSPVLFNDSW